MTFIHSNTIYKVYYSYVQQYYGTNNRHFVGVEKMDTIAALN